MYLLTKAHFLIYGMQSRKDAFIFLGPAGKKCREVEIKSVLDSPFCTPTQNVPMDRVKLCYLCQHASEFSLRLWACSGRHGLYPVVCSVFDLVEEARDLPDGVGRGGLGQGPYPVVFTLVGETLGLHRSGRHGAVLLCQHLNDCNTQRNCRH